MPLARILLAVILLATFTLGCEIKKAADEMKDSTNEIKDTSTYLAKRTEDLEAELTKKESHAMLLYHLDLLFSEGQFQGAPKHNEPNQLLAAGGAVQSMLFQYWKGDYKEDVQWLDARFALSVKALFPRLVLHTPRDFKIDVFSPDNSFTGIGALGAMMDELDASYEKGLRNNNLPVLSFYEVVTEALRGRHTLERKELLPLTSKRVLQFAEEAKYLLQLRHNYLPMVVVCRMTNFQDRNDFGKLWFRFLGEKTRLEDKTPEAIAEWKHYLELAMKTRQDLRAMGIPVEYNDMLNGLVAALNFDQATWINLDPAKLTPEDKLRRDFAIIYNKVVLDTMLKDAQ